MKSAVRSHYQLCAVLLVGMTALACSDETEAVDFVFASSTNEVPLAELMEGTDRMLVWIDRTEGDELYPYPPNSECGGGALPCCGPDECGDGVLLSIEDSDPGDLGLELAAVFRDISPDFEDLRLERGSLPAGGLRATFQGERGALRTFFGYIDAVPGFRSPPEQVTVALSPNPRSFGPFLTQLVPGDVEPPACLFKVMVLDFSRPVDRETLAGGIEVDLLEVSGESSDPQRVPTMMSTLSDPFVRTVTLRATEDQAFFQDFVELGPGVQFRYRVRLNDTILDEAGGSFRPYEREWSVVCAMDDVATELDTLNCGVPGAGIECPAGFGCEEGVCQPHSCEQVACVENEVCNQMTRQCEPDCRLWGGSLFCPGASVCSEDGTCTSE